MTPISSLGEFGLINKLTKGFPVFHQSTIKGVGDDAAQLDSKERQILISTDLLVEDIHFDMVYTPLKHLGYKAVVVNLSDIYAMNAIPEQITVSVALSSKYTVEAIAEIYEGILHACNTYKVDLVGGDTTSSIKGLVISVTAIGYAQKEKIVYRSGAKEGDLICVSGNLGAAYLGLQMLEREKKIFLEHPDVQPDIENEEYLIRRHLKPEARKDIIQFFDEVNLVPTSMIDVSDGLSSDLLHICTKSNVGCEINEAFVPMSEEMYQRAIKFNLDPITCVLSGGEDYELLFTISNEDETKVSEHPDIQIIGQINNIEAGRILLTKGGNRHALTAQGWNHFKS
jgi:thiamine-monophosphate kinase